MTLNKVTKGHVSFNLNTNTLSKITLSGAVFEYDLKRTNSSYAFGSLLLSRSSTNKDDISVQITDWYREDISVRSSEDSINVAPTVTGECTDRLLGASNYGIQVVQRTESTQYEEIGLQTEMQRHSQIVHVEGSSQTVSAEYCDSAIQTTEPSIECASTQTPVPQCVHSQTQAVHSVDNVTQCDIVMVDGETQAVVESAHNSQQTIIKMFEDCGQQTVDKSVQNTCMQTTYEFTNSVEVQVQPNCKENNMQTDNHLAQHKSIQAATTSSHNQCQTEAPSMDSKDIQVVPDVNEMGCQIAVGTDTAIMQTDWCSCDQSVQAVMSASNAPTQTDLNHELAETQTDLVWVGNLQKSTACPNEGLPLTQEAGTATLVNTSIGCDVPDEIPVHDEAFTPVKDSDMVQENQALTDEKTCQTDPVTIIIGDASFLVEKLKVYSEENQVEVTEETQGLHEEAIAPEEIHYPEDIKTPSNTSQPEPGPHAVITPVHRPDTGSRNPPQQSTTLPHTPTSQMNPIAANLRNQIGDSNTPQQESELRVRPPSPTQKPGTFSCPFCDHSAQDAASLYTHLHSTHDCPKTSSRRGKSRCDKTLIVGEDGSAVTSLQYNERRSEAEQKLPKTGELNTWRKRIKNDENVLNVPRVVAKKTNVKTIENKRAFACQHCPKLFTKSAALYVHMENSHRFQPNKQVGRPLKTTEHLISKSTLMGMNQPGIRVQNGSSVANNASQPQSQPVHVQAPKPASTFVADKNNAGVTHVTSEGQQVMYVYADDASNVSQPVEQGSTAPTVLEHSIVQLAPGVPYITEPPGRRIRTRGGATGVLPRAAQLPGTESENVQVYTTEVLDPAAQPMTVIKEQAVPTLQYAHSQQVTEYVHNDAQPLQLQYAPESQYATNTQYTTEPRYVTQQVHIEQEQVPQVDNSQETEYIYVQNAETGAHTWQQVANVATLHSNVQVTETGAAYQTSTVPVIQQVGSHIQMQQADGEVQHATVLTQPQGQIAQATLMHPQATSVAQTHVVMTPATESIVEQHVEAVQMQPPVEQAEQVENNVVEYEQQSGDAGTMMDKVQAEDQDQAMHHLVVSEEQVVDAHNEDDVEQSEHYEQGSSDVDVTGDSDAQAGQQPSDEDPEANPLVVCEDQTEVCSDLSVSIETEATQEVATKVAPRTRQVVMKAETDLDAGRMTRSRVVTTRDSRKRTATIKTTVTPAKRAR